MRRAQEHVRAIRPCVRRTDLRALFALHAVHVELLSDRIMLKVTMGLRFPAVTSILWCARGQPSLPPVLALASDVQRLVRVLVRLPL